MLVCRELRVYNNILALSYVIGNGRFIGCILELECLRGHISQSSTILLNDIADTLATVDQVHVRSECISIGNDPSTNCALVRVTLSVHYFHMFSSIGEALESLCTQEAAPAIWSRDGELEDILICSGGGSLLSEPNPIYFGYRALPNVCATTNEKMLSR